MTPDTVRAGDARRLPAALPVRRSDLGRSFRLLWAGQSVSLLGDQITLIALPLLAVRYLAASTFDVGMIGMFLRLPFLLVGLPAGVWVSRIGLRRSMISADVARGLAIGGAAAVTVASPHGTWTLFAAALVIGTATVFFQLSYQTIVPDLVADQGRWQAANTRLSLSESMAVLLGPAAGGLAIAWLTPPGALGLDGASYAVSVLTLGLLARRPRPRAHLGPAPEAGAGSLRRQVLDGWRYVRASPILDAIMWTGAAYNLGSAMYEALIVVFAVRGLHLTPTQFGLAIGVGGVGFPVGSALAGPLTRRLGLGPSLMWAAIPSVAGLILSALAGGTAPEVYLAAGTFLVGVGQGCFAVSAMTLRQLAAAPAFRARATAVHRFASWGTLPIGALLAGLIGQAAGMRAAMLTAGALAALCAWPLLASPLRKVRTAAEATALA